MKNKTKHDKEKKKDKRKRGKRAKKPLQGQSEQLGHCDDDIEKAWWMTCWLDKNLRLYRAPIASRLTTIAGSHESSSNILVLSSAYDLPLRIGESLDYLSMKAFASASMMSPSGRNNELPRAVGNELIEIHSDCSAKTSILGISAVFSVRDCSYSYAGGMIVDNNLLIFNYGEFIAAVSAMLIAISCGYRDIVISTDCESLVKAWNDAETGTPTENVDRQLLALKDIIQSQGYSVRIQHVKGHGIDFRNTMADGLAEMGYSRPTNAVDDLTAFDYAELKAAYQETIVLNEQLEARLADIGKPASHDPSSPDRYEEDGKSVAETFEAATEQTLPSNVISDVSSDESHGEISDSGHFADNHDGTTDGETWPQSQVRSDSEPVIETPDRNSASTGPAPHRGEGRHASPNQSHGDRQRSTQPRPHSLSINQPTVEVCRLLNETYDNVNVNRVDRLVASGAIEKWENLSDSQANLQYARNLVSAPSVTSDNQRIDAIWNAIAKNVARKITKRYSAQKKRSILVMRTMLVARLCGVPIEPSIDYVLTHQHSQ